MDHNKSREVVLERISHALKPCLNSSKPKEINQRYDELYVRSDENNINMFIDSVSELGVQVFQLLNVTEFKSHFQKVVATNGWSKFNCIDASLFKSLQLDSNLGDWTDDTLDCEVAITGCEVIVARTGTIVMSSSQIYGRILPIHTPIHIIIGYEDLIVYDLPNAFERIQLKYQGGFPSALFFSSGVSSTGDIEKTLVRGVHGPEKVYVYLFKN